MQGILDGCQQRQVGLREEIAASKRTFHRLDSHITQRDVSLVFVE